MQKWRSVALLVACVVLALSVWFAGTAVQGELQRIFGLSRAWSGLATAAVGLGSLPAR